MKEGATFCHDWPNSDDRLEAALRSVCALSLGRSKIAILVRDSAWPAPATDGALGQIREYAPETGVVAVSVADLDLSSPQGALLARERIRNTARRLCSQLTSSQGPASYYSHCVVDATAGALRQINDSAPGN